MSSFGSGIMTTPNGCTYVNNTTYNTLTRLHDDQCEQASRCDGNQAYSNYMVSPPKNFPQSSDRQYYYNSMNTRGAYYNFNGDEDGQYVDTGSALLNGVNGNILTSIKDRAGKQLFTRPYATTP